MFSKQKGIEYTDFSFSKSSSREGLFLSRSTDPLYREYMNMFMIVRSPLDDPKADYIRLM